MDALHEAATAAAEEERLADEQALVLHAKVCPDASVRVRVYRVVLRAQWEHQAACGTHVFCGRACSQLALTEC